MKIDMTICSTDFIPNADFDKIERFLTESMKDRLHLKDDQVSIETLRGRDQFSQLKGDFQGNIEEVKDFFDEIVDIAKKQFG